MHVMAALFVGVGKPTRGRVFSGTLRILLIALPLLISATIPAESQDFPQFKKVNFAAQPSTSLSNEIGEAPSSGGRRSFQTIRKIFRPKGNTLGLTDCENSVDCDKKDEKPVRPKVTYHDAYRIRAEQCKEFDKQTYNGKNINWKPYIKGHLDPCKLFCLASGHRFYAKLKNHVRDGTPCGKDYSKVCIQGNCQKRPKRCKSIDEPCKVEKRRKIIGVFNSTKLHIGYNFVATIPAGATNVNIEELTKSRSYLALKDDKSDAYYLNGHWMISLSKSFRLVGSEAHYKRNGDTRYGGETIKVDGPLKNSIDVMIIYQGDPSTLMYSFFVTEEEYHRLKGKSSVNGGNLHFGKNAGKRLEEGAVPKNAKEGERSPSSGSDKRQDYSGTSQRRADSVTFPGQTSPPRVKFRKDGFSYSQRQATLSQGYVPPGRQQSSQGGDQKSTPRYGSSWIQFGGSRNNDKQKPVSNAQFSRRPVLSQQVFKPGQFRNSKLSEHGNGNPGNGYSQSLNRFGNPKTRYPVGRWQGQGPKVSEYQGRRWEKPLGRTSDTSGRQFYTSDEKGGNERTLQTYVWRTAVFTPCSSTCAGGTQSSVVNCIETTTGETVLDVKCDPNGRPNEQIRVCNLQPCPASWAPQEWKDCSKSCGEGVQMRDLMCKQVIDRSGKKVPVMLPITQCSVHQRPEVIRKCFLEPCPEIPKPNWVVEQWGKCSVECSHGIRKRNVFCKDHNNETVEVSECDRKNKPSKLKACYLGLCRASWYTRTYWSDCSKTCGGGIQNRPVICARIDGNSLNELYCKDYNKPKDSQNCNQAKCKGIWMTSEWSQCSTDCGIGVQERKVICMRYISGQFRETLNAHCSVGNKPAVTKKCENNNCVPSWFTTPWSECSVTCGNGVKTRRVSCLDGKGTKVGGCKVWQRPMQRRDCRPKPCPGKKKKAAEPNRSCVDNPPRDRWNYCNIILRIKFCRIESYRISCCKTCALYDPQ